MPWSGNIGKMDLVPRRKLVCRREGIKISFYAFKDW